MYGYCSELNECDGQSNCEDGTDERDCPCYYNGTRYEVCRTLQYSLNSEKKSVTVIFQGLIRNSGLLSISEQ